jgi:hypothetical protein
MKVVTREWLEECLTQGALIGEERYLPELCQQGQSNLNDAKNKK